MFGFPLSGAPCVLGQGEASWPGPIGFVRRRRGVLILGRALSFPLSDRYACVGASGCNWWRSWESPRVTGVGDSLEIRAVRASLVAFVIRGACGPAPLRPRSALGCTEPFRARLAKLLQWHLR